MTLFITRESQVENRDHRESIEKMSKPYTTLWAYPWDILDDGIERALDTIAGMGFRTISLAVSYHSVEHLRPQRTAAKYFVAPDAAVYFQPDISQYANSRIQPQVSPLVLDRRDPLRLIGESCARREISLTAWTVCLHNTYQGRRYPECCVTNVYGDVFTSQLDPTNPAVRAYIIALCGDLASTGVVDCLELESIGFGGRPHFHGHPKIGLDLGPAGWFLFALPASPSARRIAEEANVDADRLFANIRETLAPRFRDGLPLPGSPADWAAKISDLDRYLRVLQASVTGLVQEIRAATGSALSVIAMGDYWTSLCNYPALARIADSIEVLAYTPNPDAVAGRVNELRHGEGVPADKIVVGLQAFGTAAPDEKTLLACVERALDLEVTRFSFYNYGIVPEAHFPWLCSANDLIYGRASR